MIGYFWHTALPMDLFNKQGDQEDDTLDLLPYTSMPHYYRVWLGESQIALTSVIREEKICSRFIITGYTFPLCGKTVQKKNQDSGSLCCHFTFPPVSKYLTFFREGGGTFKKKIQCQTSWPQGLLSECTWHWLGSCIMKLVELQAHSVLNANFGGFDQIH